MKKKDAPEAICRSVFKGGKNTTTEHDFTKKWIELINTLEEGKSGTFAKNHDHRAD